MNNLRPLKYQSIPEALIEKSPDMPGDNRTYWPVLDGIRAIAALMVMVFHWCFYHSTPVPGSLLAQLAALSRIGQVGVDLFFVLSGFLITSILLRSRGTPHAFRNFYLRRACRIFPLYYLAIGIYYGVAGSFSGLAWYATYTQNLAWIFGVHPQGPTHFWSLAVEEHFYLVWPFLMLTLPRRFIGAAIFVVIGLALASRGCVLLLQGPEDAFYFFTLCRMDALAFGALLAFVNIRFSLREHATKIVRFGVACAALTLLIWWLALSGAATVWLQFFKFTAAGLTCTALMAYSLCLRPGQAIYQALTLRPLRGLGRISYGLYVFHPLVFDVSDRIFAPLPFAIRFTLAMAATVLVAFASWNLYERHFLRLKNHSVKPR